ncbi:Hsp20/alpha crystallin family protein [Consotaella salsifontis]|uniref:Heat shock protein Hsp20 n=1 Tax=Consotaella salsifontis TaxID=1365950 RepID=A0A1T4S9C8_9HYPH|nr:Hsp20/alpha crystallin family protein [Consotaella salsifontis]SKA24910.1 heat shock protein Hsp20 [Consotaella salsifontis]
MNVRDLVPWGRGGAVQPSAQSDVQNPFFALQREMNRLFDDAFANFGVPATFGAAQVWPKAEVSETDKELRISVELPGMEEKDVDVTLANGVLSVRGEKKVEKKDEEKQYSEIQYGTFGRRIPIEWEVKPEEVKASFKNGVLTVTVPKSEKVQAQTKRIPISKA